MSKKTVIIGASPNPTRYAYLAANKLVAYNHEIVPIGIKTGTVAGMEILDLRTKPKVHGVDTVTMYLNPTNQEAWKEYILSLKPSRIIFNPGTENDAFQAMANDQGIETLDACTLVMLSANQF